MHLLVATPLRVFLFDLITGRTTLLRSGDSEYFGISWNNERLVMSHSGVDNEALKEWQDYRNSVCGYLQCFNSVSHPVKTEKELVIPHQIEFVDDKIITANTGRNCLSVFDSNGTLLDHVYPGPMKWDRSEDGRTGDHFNSVHRVDDTLWVIAHNFDRPSAVWKFTWPEMKVVDVKQTTASWAHNIWPGEYGTVICNSRFGALYEVNTGENIWKADEKKVIARGLAVSEDYIFVGRSEFGKRGERKYSNGGIWIIDRKTLKTEDRFVLPGSGCVNEIRLVGIADECHNNHILTIDRTELVKNYRMFDIVDYKFRAKLGESRSYRLLEKGVKKVSGKINSKLSRRNR